jgi:hypothetical protein
MAKFPTHCIREFLAKNREFQRPISDFPSGGHQMAELRMRPRGYSKPVFGSSVTAALFIQTALGVTNTKTELLSAASRPSIRHANFVGAP